MALAGLALSLGAFLRDQGREGRAPFTAKAVSSSPIQPSTAPGLAKVRVGYMALESATLLSATWLSAILLAMGPGQGSELPCLAFAAWPEPPFSTGSAKAATYSR